MSTTYERGQATRGKKERWLHEIDHLSDCNTIKLIKEEVRHWGMDWLTDEQVDDLVSSAVSKRRATNHRQIENRRVYAEQKRKERAA